MSEPEGRARLSLNQITTRGWSVGEAVAGCRRFGIDWVGLWRDKVAEFDLDAAVRSLRAHSMRVSSLCRGGFFAAATEADRERRRADNRAAVDEAVALGTEVLVLVCGGLGGVDLDRARQMVVDGVEDLAPYAATHGVRLAIEPLHPMFCADRSVIVTLDQALDLAERFPPEHVGVMVDTFHVWWDPGVYRAIERAGERILGFQVGDWLDPPPDVLLGRGMMGDGPIELRRLREAVDAAGYDGPIEVEIFNADVWAAPGERVLEQVRDRYVTHVA